MAGTTLLDELVAATLDASGKTECWRDAFGLAFKLGLELQPRQCEGATLRGQAIQYDRSASPPLQQRLIAQAVARWALLQWDLLAPPPAVQCVAERLVAIDAAGGRAGARRASFVGVAR